MPQFDQEVFDLLADIVASDRLMVFTGSGISAGLLDQTNHPLPGWKTLLEDIAGDIDLSDEERKDFSDLLTGEPSGQEMIEAASILEMKNEPQFTEQLTRRLTPKAFDKQPVSVQKQQERRHKAILDSSPRGILTLNIDCGHWTALKNRNEHDRWARINPLHENSENEIRHWLAHREKPLLFEAHGSLDDPAAGFVFSHRAYRDLLHRTPTYRALLRYLLSEYSFVFVGFGLTDLDFDQFLHEHAMDFGEPLRKHVVIRKGRDRARDKRQAARYRRRFGIYTLNVKDHPDVWQQLEKSMRHEGPAMRKTLTQCLDADKEKRSQGHHRLQMLGSAGRAVATDRLLDLIETSADLHAVTEAIYSLGYLRFGPTEPARQRARRAVLQEIEQPKNTERLAHALSVVEPFLDQADLDRMESAAANLRGITLKVPPGFPDPDGRNPAYLESVILRLRAEHGIFSPRPHRR